jgi:TolA-binding protein
MRFSFRALILFLVATVGLSTAFVSAAGQSETTTPTNTKKITASKTTAVKKAPAKKLTVAEQLQQLNDKMAQQQAQIQQQQGQIQQLQTTN